MNEDKLLRKLYLQLPKEKREEYNSKLKLLREEERKRRGTKYERESYLLYGELTEEYFAQYYINHEKEVDAQIEKYFNRMEPTQKKSLNRKKYFSEYYKKNLEKIRERNKEYYKKNKKDKYGGIKVSLKGRFDNEQDLKEIYKLANGFTTPEYFIEAAYRMEWIRPDEELNIEGTEEFTIVESPEVRFLREEIFSKNINKIKRIELYELYKDWCKNKKEKIIYGKNKFYDIMLSGPKVTVKHESQGDFFIFENDKI